MMRGPWLRCVTLVIGLSCAALLLEAAPARADTAQEARASFERGVEASRAQRWEDARREFMRSRDLVVKPSTLFNLAVADLKLGLSDEALEALDAFERIANPSEHAQMLERAATLRDEAERNKEAARPAQDRARGLIEPGGLSADAKARFAEGRDAYARGDDTLALAAFLDTERMSGRDELWFDIGVVADRLREDERAIDAFERFVSAHPDLPEAQLAQRHLERLKRLRAETGSRDVQTSTASDQNDATPVSSAKGPAESSRAAPRALIVLGALFSAGIVGPALWYKKQHGWQLDCDARPADCTNRSSVTAQARAALATTILFGVAGASLLTSGAVLLAKRRRAALDSLQAAVARDHLMLSAQFTF